MISQKSVTFEEGCNLYLNNCKERNLREGTINHYRQSYLNFYKFFDKEMSLSDFTEKHYSDYILHLRKTLSNDVSINSYLRDMITTMHFLMNEGYVEPFKMQAIKVDKPQIETYSEEELRKLLEKPNLRTCTFTEYKCWVMTNFLFSTGVRQRSMHFVKIKDVDFDNQVVHIKADFIAKIQIALKECHETEYWLKLFINSKIIDEGTYAKLSNAAGKIRRILIASLNTAKGNLDK